MFPPLRHSRSVLSGNHRILWMTPTRVPPPLHTIDAGMRLRQEGQHGTKGTSRVPALLPLPTGEGRGEGRTRPRPRQEAPRSLSPAARRHGKTRPRPDKRPPHPHPLPEGEGAGGGTTTGGGPTGLGKHWIPAFAGMTALVSHAPCTPPTAPAKPSWIPAFTGMTALVSHAPCTPPAAPAKPSWILAFTGMTAIAIRAPGASAAARPLDSCFRRNDDALMTTLSLPRLPPGASPTARPPGFLLSQE